MSYYMNVYHMYYMAIKLFSLSLSLSWAAKFCWRLQRNEWAEKFLLKLTTQQHSRICLLFASFSLRKSHYMIQLMLGNKNFQANHKAGLKFLVNYHGFFLVLLFSQSAGATRIQSVKRPGLTQFTWNILGSVPGKLILYTTVLLTNIPANLIGHGHWSSAEQTTMNWTITNGYLGKNSPKILMQWIRRNFLLKITTQYTSEIWILFASFSLRKFHHMSLLILVKKTFEAWLLIVWELSTSQPEGRFENYCQLTLNQSLGALVPQINPFHLEYSRHSAGKTHLVYSSIINKNSCQANWTRPLTLWSFSRGGNNEQQEYKWAYGGDFQQQTTTQWMSREVFTEDNTTVNHEINILYTFSLNKRINC